MKTIITVILLCGIISITSCRKNPPSNKTHKAKFKVFKSCGEPLANKPIRLYLSTSTYKFKQIAEVWTDSLGNVEVEHAYSPLATVTLQVYLSTVSGASSKPFEYTLSDFTQEEYFIDFVVFGNGSQIPIQLNNFSTYTMSDTIHYKVLSNIGDTADIRWRHKIGPFSNTFIDTLSFPNCAFAYILNKSPHILTSSLQVQTNTIIYGKSIEECLNYQNTGKYFHFNQAGCGVIDTILLDK